jgi:hypothetical protein
MPTVNYSLSAPYLPAASGAGLGPALEVELIRGPRTTRAVGVVDSGSTITVFNPEHAELLGIERVEDGELQHVQTQGGEVDYYIFDVEMELRIDAHINRFPCRVGFFPARRPRNILGRNYIFAHYEIGFRDRGDILHLRPED